MVRHQKSPHCGMLIRTKRCNTGKSVTRLRVGHVSTDQKSTCSTENQPDSTVQRLLLSLRELATIFLDFAALSEQPPAAINQEFRAGYIFRLIRSKKQD